jgi:2-oxoisovalerate dehydrogenase E2 component (dihydrolipoyl transacylase)
VITDKLVAKIPSSFSGKITKLNFKNDDICQVGQALLEMEVDDNVQIKEEVSSEHAEETKKEESKPEEPKAEPPKEEPKKGAAPGGKVLTTPAVRGLAAEMKIDINKVTPTGKGGRITKDDVLKYAEKMKGKASAGEEKKKEVVATQPAPKALEQDSLKKLTGIRRAMVKSMTDALTIPSFNLQDCACIDKIKKIRKDYAKFNPGKKMSYLPFFLKAFSQAILKYPVFNAVSNSNVDNEGCIYEYIEKAEHNISVAIDSPAGLVVPNLKSVQRKSIVQINEELRELIERGRKGTLTHSDLSDGTFTLSSISGIGSRVGTPVIFRPQVAIAAMCRVETIPDFIKKADGDYETRPTEMMQLSLTCDNRIISGPTAARFMNEVRKHIEDIEGLLLTLK